MRLIDADKLYPDCMTKNGALAISQNQIANALTVKDRPKGKWGKHGECPFCSYIQKWKEDNFCGNCGANLRNS